MQKVLALLSIVLVTLRSQLVSADSCNKIRQATSTFIPVCDPDLYIKYPYYENASYYYSCDGFENPELFSCSLNHYFCYVLQSCVDCADYIQPPACEDLLPPASQKCTPISGGTTSPGIPGDSTDLTGPTLPTPRYPPANTTTTSTTTSTAKPTTTSTTKTTVTKPSGNSTEPITDPTPPVIDETTTTPSSKTTIPPPPSPSTQNTLIPLPPTPPPTPPNVSVEPPYVSPQPGS